MNNDQKHTVTVLRLPQSLRSSDQMEADALNGIGSIPGVIDVEIEASDADSVTLSYTWTGSEQFQATDEHLANFGLRKRWKNEA
ncbi:MAG TPA: hypothetical protein VN283_06145 [Thiobacillus sp.]|nr:hypothetical protein [Thiobacillus sp.]